ncbi:MAG: MarR family transcriptional regulator [Vicingaceae bacterium]|nr:MarR family transcriptional regulator [Vicingaceae bacterium]
MKFKNIKEFNPQECISGRVKRLNRLTANIFRKHLSPFGITDSQLTLLFILSKKGKCNQKEITEITCLEKSSLNRNLKRLVDKKYISKQDFPLLQLSHEGKVFVENIIPEWEKAMTEIKELITEDGINGINIALKNITKTK